MADRDFGTWMRQHRKRLALTQVELAYRIKASPLSVSRWERGVQFPGAFFVREMAELFEVNIAELAGFQTYPELPISSAWHVPYRRNAYFTGHEGTLHVLHEALFTDKSAVLMHALAGLGGIGKTQLAVEYAYRYQEEYQAVLWLSAVNSEVLLTDMIQIVQLLNLPVQDKLDQHQITYAVRRWLETRENWLLVLDNVEDINILENVLPHGRKGYTGHVLLTTRAQAVGTLARRIAVEKMEEGEGALLVLRRAKLLDEDSTLEAVSEVEQTGAKSIATELDGLPLALDQAGAFIDENQCSIFEYLDLYRRKRAELLYRRGSEPSGHPLSVATTFLLAIDKVKATNPAAVELLTFCAYLHADAIAEDIIVAGASQLGELLQPVAADPILLKEAIGELGKYSLIRRNVGTKMLSMHRLVQAVLLDPLDEDVQLVWSERVVRALDIACTSSTPSPFGEAYLPHMLAGTQLIEKRGFLFEQAAHLLDQTATALRERGLYSQAQPLCFSAMKMYNTLFGPDDPNVAHCWLNGARLFMHLAHFEMVELLYERARMLYERLVGHDHLSMLEILNEGTLFYLRCRRIDLAQTCCEQALMICSKHNLPETQEVARCVNIAAKICLFFKEYNRALQFHQQALAMRKRLLGSEHLDVSESLADLAVLMALLGDTKQAERLIREVITMRERVLGSDHPLIADALEILADILVKKAHFERAEELYQRVLTIRERKLRPYHPDVAKSHDRLANVYHWLRKEKEAQKHYQQARDIHRKNIILPPGEAINSFAEDLIPAFRMIGREDAAARLEEMVTFIQSTRGKYGIKIERNDDQGASNNT